MNPVYAVMESPYRWLMVAGGALLAGMVGAMTMIAWAAPHWLPRFWFYAWFFVTVFCLVEAYLDWRQEGADGDGKT